MLQSITLLDIKQNTSNTTLKFAMLLIAAMTVTIPLLKSAANRVFCVIQA